VRAFFIGCLVSGLVFAQAPEIVKVEGKDLRKVPGPLAQTERLRDPVMAMGESRMGLEIRRSARSGGTVPTVAAPAGNSAIAHKVTYPAGWQAFAVEAAPGETLKARLTGDHQAWFLVRCVTRQGHLEKGMLQNLIATGNPEASYTNHKPKATTVYFVVDTTDTAGSTEPYTLTITRAAAGH